MGEGATYLVEGALGRGNGAVLGPWGRNVAGKLEEQRGDHSGWSKVRGWEEWEKVRAGRGHGLVGCGGR